MADHVDDSSAHPSGNLVSNRIALAAFVALLGTLVVVTCSPSDLPDEPPPVVASTPDQSSSAEDPSLGTVVEILDGVTVEIENAGSVYRVRYLGVAVPISGDSGGAAEFNRFLVQGKTVVLAKDLVDRDTDGALLRYVYADGEMVNTKLLTSGWGMVADYPAEFDQVEAFLHAQADAEVNNRGVWSDAVAQAPDSPTPTPVAPGGFGMGGTLPSPLGPGGPGICDFSGSTDPIIKGNVDPLSAERLYHVPGGLFYSTTVIDESDGEAWFCTETQAEALGWKRSKR